MTSSQQWKDRFRGILPAIVTPVDAQGGFAAGSFERLIARLYDAGVHGLYVCGQTGEGLLQPVNMRQQVAEVAVKSSPQDKVVIIHVGSPQLADAVQLARHASRIGASAISSLPLAGPSFPEVRHYYRELAQASDVPCLVYFFPDAFPVINSMDQVLELCEIPNVVGLKFTDYNLYALQQIHETGRVIFNGRDEVLAAGLLMGADGGIGSVYNLVPELFLQVYESARRGDWKQARETQVQINELIRLILHFPLISAIKTILKWRGIDCGDSLPPNALLTPEDAANLRTMLRQSSLGESLPGAA
jgi:N-acetylneuraminate lyase